MRTASMAARHTSGVAPREWTAEIAGEVLREGDRVMHPAHGVGRVERIAVEEVSGYSLDLVHIVFDEARLTLRVPTTKVRSIGLRRIASRKLIDEALAVLKGRARQSKVMWSRRAQDYQAKINSGDPRVVAEVVRDLGRNAVSGGQSFSERQLYEAALDRLACEVAAVESVDREAAVARITAQVAAAAG
jgi:CarD family transcriptional regulator